MPNRNERHEKVGHVEVVPEEGKPYTELVEEIDPSLIAEDPPGLTVAEWESARELDRGARAVGPDLPPSEGQLGPSRL